MDIKAVLLARIIGLVDMNELNPKGSVFFPSLVPKIIERFSFQEFPQKIEDFDEAKGISFRSGFYRGHTVDEIKIYNDGVTVDTRSSTEEAQEVLLDTLGWMRDENGITFSPEMITRWGYVSHLVFRSKANLDLVSPALRILMTSVSNEVRKLHRKERDFHVEGVRLNFERVDSQAQMSSFNIERRAKELFEKEKYFSSAPLPTQVHIQLLEQFERNVVEGESRNGVAIGVTSESSR